MTRIQLICAVTLLMFCGCGSGEPKSSPLSSEPVAVPVEMSTTPPVETTAMVPDEGSTTVASSVAPLFEPRPDFQPVFTGKEQFPEVKGAVTIAQLFAEAEADPAAFEKKYAGFGTPMEVSGIVGRFEINEGVTRLTFVNDDGRPLGIHEVSTVDRRPWVYAWPGDRVTLRGKVSGSSPIYIRDARLVSCERSQDSVVYRAEQLAIAFADDPGILKSKFSATDITVTGSVVVTEKRKYSKAAIVLKTDAGVTFEGIYGSFSPYEFRHASTLQPGDKVTLTGALTSDESGKNLVIKNPLIVSPDFPLPAPLSKTDGSFVVDAKLVSEWGWKEFATLYSQFQNTGFSTTLTGTVSSIEDKFGDIIVTLATEQEYPVAITMKQAGLDASGVKVGDRVQFQGALSIMPDNALMRLIDVPNASNVIK
ncbi:MAG: hypothetical protein R3C01_02355 [Planctomycetaceae bacterium]